MKANTIYTNILGAYRSWYDHCYGCADCRSALLNPLTRLEKECVIGFVLHATWQKEESKLRPAA